MKTRIPETIVCINCNHNVIIKLYKVDTTVNSSQGHFHTIHNPGEPAYTVYCINCGHFMTNDPDQTTRTRTKKSSAKPTRKAKGRPKAVVAPAGKKTIKPPTVTKASAAKAKPKTTQTTRTKTATRPEKKRSPRKKAK